MAQHDYAIADQIGLSFLSDLNSALAAGVTLNSGTTAPPTTYPGMLWLDTSTTPPVLKQRNQANSAWANFGAQFVADVGLPVSPASLTYLRWNGSAFEARTAQQVADDVGPLTAAGSTTVAGRVELATASETAARSSASLAVTPQTLQSLLVLGTAVNSTSGSAIDFTNIPSWAKRITVSFRGVSTTGTSVPQVQIGSASGIETSGYIASAMDGTAVGSTSGFPITRASSAVASFYGVMVLLLTDPSDNTWTASGAFVRGDSLSSFSVSAGAKGLSGVLARVRVATTDTFDSGSINIMYE